MASIIQIRRDTAANWTAANTILAQGELALETDTLKLKAGDGTTAWTSLAYYTLGTTGFLAANSTIDMADNVITQAEIKDYSETVQAMAANDVDCSLGNVQTKSISGSVTLTFSNPPASGKAGAFTLITTLSSSPVITWPSSVKWAGGTAPSLTSVGIDVFTFLTTDGGTAWLGFASGTDMQ